LDDPATAQYKNLVRGAGETELVDLYPIRKAIQPRCPERRAEARNTTGCW
jgi:hypothetical protein